MAPSTFWWKIRIGLEGFTDSNADKPMGLRSPMDVSLLDAHLVVATEPVRLHDLDSRRIPGAINVESLPFDRSYGRTRDGRRMAVIPLSNRLI